MSMHKKLQMDPLVLGPHKLFSFGLLGRQHINDSLCTGIFYGTLVLQVNTEEDPWDRHRIFV